MPLTAKQKADKAELAETLLAAHPVPEGEGAWAREARAAAAARLRGMGAPGRRDEYWKFTDPGLLTAPLAADAGHHGSSEEIFAERGALNVAVVDGVLRRDLSDPLEMEGVEIVTLAEALAADIHWARDLFGVLEARGQDPVARPLAALNTAHAGQGLVIRATGEAPRPIRIRASGETPGTDSFVHHLVRVEEGASLTLLETGMGAARLNAVIEADVADGGALHHLRAYGPDSDRLAATHLFARIGERSTLKTFVATADGRLVRFEQVVEIVGDDAVAHLAGACLGEGSGFVHDDTVFITHEGERCESRQVFKKVLRSGARGVFQGKILVRQGAQKTDGYQISQGLLLDDEADFLAKPELEIYADDVVCSHGSTCGAADEEALYYLRARGIPRREAENLLVQSFVGEAVEEIDDADLAEEMRERIAAWVHGGAGRAAAGTSGGGA